MKDKQPPAKYMGIFQTRFEEENAIALAEAAEEQKRLRAKRLTSKKFDPESSFIEKGTSTIYCRRKT